MAAVYKTRSIMPRRGATGDTGGAAGGKVRNRSTNQQKKLLISESRLLIAAAFIGVKKTTVTQIAQFDVQPSSGFCWIPL
jgi:hypothetical protein